jgi:cyclopropane fatty-acyl-phospholipid synthase-like methyltransferase
MKPAIAKALVDPVLRRVRGGRLTLIEPDGKIRHYGSGAVEATIWMRSDRVWQAFLGGSLTLADAYADGLWDSPDPVALVRLAARNMPPLDRLRRTFAFALRPVGLLRTLTRRNGRNQARRNIAAHYDLGNELFEQMLDPTLTYSAALFVDPQASLEQAQRAKLERVCEELNIGPEDRVIEIGTGWGSFALHAAGTRGCHVTTTTISAEQYEYARRRVSEAGLEDRIEEFIFPGGSLPSLEVLKRSFERRTDLETLDVYDLTDHYVETLRHWRARFLAGWGELRSSGYDERFKRIWTLYLAYCEGGFAERRISDVQILLAKPLFTRGPTTPDLPSEGTLEHAL